jgi:hypothetical protein
MIQVIANQIVGLLIKLKALDKTTNLSNAFFRSMRTKHQNIRLKSHYLSFE